MLAGTLVMLDANLPAAPARSRTGLAAQAMVGFVGLVAGWWLRRQALRPREGDD